MRVVATDVAEEELHAVCGGAAVAVAGDVTDVEFHARLVDEAQRLGGPDALVTAAGVLRRASAIGDVTVADWHHHADVIERSTFFLVRAVAERIRERGRPGSVVCFSSVSAHHGGLGGTWAYAAANAGVLALVRGLARTYGAAGIRVNGIAPGAVDSPMMTRGLAREQLAAVVERVPLGRMADPAEIASVCLFLLGDAASYVTGVTLDVDGGWMTR
jgi:NAD(P)-dependent dehydrogenase (short-subunit alcohol dehydrogenase family)